MDDGISGDVRFRKRIVYAAAWCYERLVVAEVWHSPHWQAEIGKINDCAECRVCVTHCPCQQEISRQLWDNLAACKATLAGRVRV